MAAPLATMSPAEWAVLHRADDGEQQPISAVELEFGLETQARRHGLEVMWPLMEALGNPERAYLTIHVTGSKGKGSTVAMLTAILRAAGYRVGAYTSPSLTHFGERIQVNGESISDADCERHVAELRPVIESLPERPKFFEAATAIAFRHFAEQQVDVAVIEVGIGGGRDATNVIVPEVSIITSIELEHTAILGSTLEEIAREKAGIIKPGVPLVTAVDEPEALEAIEEMAAVARAPMTRLDRDFAVKGATCGLRDQRFDLVGHSRSIGADARWDALELSLAGDAQSTNAALAVMAARLIAPRFPRLTEAAIRTGLSSTRWPGRLELRDGRPNVLMDVAHTPASAAQLRHYLDRFFAGVPKTLVIGVLRDKRLDELAETLADAFDTVIVAPVKWHRSAEPDEVRSAFLPRHEDVRIAPSACVGIEQALAETPADGLVVVAGSLFVVGEAKRRFGWV